MKIHKGVQAVFILWSCMACVRAQVVPLFNPTELGTARTTFSFDEYPFNTAANTLYQSNGFTFSRDDGGVVSIQSLSVFGMQTSSGEMGLTTASYPIGGPTQGFVPHLTINSLQPLNQMGAYFGNDAFNPNFGFQRMSIFGLSNQLLGSIDVSANNNSHVDQFIGLRSSVPFYTIRFDNLTPAGTPSPNYAVILDDLTFTTAVPEPSAGVLLGLGIVALLFLRNR
jgi:hypothetical protein